ncbi:antibiotic biosynthesis monooxygenase [Roseomonas sp. HF4]|uniref:antibiotic biosynthesis monooxygenase n=1 Tax=Roseomonas sp. HF4 TaxID=2562313 RepID=UPI0010C10DAE|nr:antibiotic biosynthesis monooxygenase [Roseomonas sp. HF4]
MRVLLLARLRGPARAGLAEAIAAYVAATRQEAGCRGCDAYLAAADPAALLLMERWVDRVAAEAHLGGRDVRAVLALPGGAVTVEILGATEALAWQPDVTPPRQPWPARHPPPIG